MPRVRDWLGPGGPLAGMLDGYEDRPGQLAMAEAVERALARSRVLVCEAGTGTGKTLAYLVPAVLSGRKVVISTATKALQEQIFEKDIPLVSKLLGTPVQAALVKGLANYLCQRRWNELRSSPDASRPETMRAVGALERWLEKTRTGDFAEVEGLGESDAIWGEIGSSSDTRIGAGCEYFESCFVTRMRREAEKARILVVNHHLFFADLALRGPHPASVLPDYDAVVFDEAHQLEDIATDFFGVRVSSARIEALVRDAERLFRLPGPVLRVTHDERTARTLAGARDAGQRLFAALAAKTGRTDARVTLPPEAWSGEPTEAWHRLDAAVEALEMRAEASDAGEPAEVLARRAKQLRDDLASIVEGAPRHVAWLEVRARSASVGASPIDVSGVLKAKVFERVPSVVLTSATLATAEGFSFLRSRVGLSGEDVDVEELAVPSPFDYPAHALVYVPRDLPDPTDAAWSEQAAARTVELVRATGGGAFVLSTSNRGLAALHAALQRAGVRPLLKQGDAPKSQLLARFREWGDAVLVATMSFWEGVDVPGRALRLVVLDKIPFAVPTDPVVQARAAALEEAGASPFVAYHVPSAAITLKQGFGRLVRTRKDAGVVAILDRRLATRGYGKKLLDALPPAGRTGDLARVRAFVAEHGLSDA